LALAALGTAEGFMCTTLVQRPCLSLRPAASGYGALRMTFAAADELHAAGKIQEAIDALGMDGSESYVRRSRWTVDLAEGEATKELRLQVLKKAEADALKAIEMDAENFAAWKASAIVKV
jgi:hypothetical protein